MISLVILLIESSPIVLCRVSVCMGDLEKEPMGGSYSDYSCNLKFIINNVSSILADPAARQESPRLGQYMGYYTFLYLLSSKFTKRMVR